MGTGKEIDDFFDAALQLERRGEWEKARSMYEQAAETWSNRPEALCAKNAAVRLRETQNRSGRPSGQSPDDLASGIAGRRNARFFGMGKSLALALALLVWDVGIEGSCAMSILVCPLWFLASILKNAIQRPGWRLALLRVSVPGLTLGLVLANAALQFRISEAHATRIIAACEEYRGVNGEYPNSLDELVPRFIPSIPPAKYCLGGTFLYVGGDGPGHLLLWRETPPYFRRIYDFERQRWSSMN